MLPLDSGASFSPLSHLQSKALILARRVLAHKSMFNKAAKMRLAGPFTTAYIRNQKPLGNKATAADVQAVVMDLANGTNGVPKLFNYTEATKTVSW